MLVQVDVGYFCAGLVVQDGIVVMAAPILKWALNKQANYVRSWVLRKRGTWTVVGE